VAIGSSTFSNIGGAVSDLFAGFGANLKAQGDEFEKQNYLLAGTLADQNAQFTEMSTAIKLTQQDRELYKSLGQTRADVAGAGFAESGSALDLLRESAQQGALTHAVMSQQGLITEAGYREQAQSYRNMASAADIAIKAEHEAAFGSFLSAPLKLAAAVASAF